MINLFSAKILSFLSLINDCCNAAERIAGNGFGGSALQEAAAELIHEATVRNSNLIKYAFRDSDDGMFFLGSCILPEDSCLNELRTLLERMSGKTCIDTGVPCKEHVSLSFYADSERSYDAQALLQSALLSVTSAYEKGDCLWKCIAGKDSGAFLGPLLKAVVSDGTYGGRIYSDELESGKLLAEIESTVAANIAQTEGKNVYEYNASAETPIPITNLIVGDMQAFSESFRKKLSSLIPKAARGGVNLFFIGNAADAVSEFNGAEILLNGKGSFFRFNGSLIPAEISTCAPAKELVDELIRIKEVSSLAEDNFDIDSPAFTMSADRCLSVPFAIEKGKICYFEIGGSAPPHALISGITGSGKSVTLHTIIDMITYNYHPDDAEIWAIDYKAVEFGCYVTERTPHIRVIGQDNSAEFSISLIDMIYGEYRARIKAFDAAGVKTLGEYRRKFGSRSMPRILIVIDEFHNLIQAVQNSFDSSYKTKLENLLKEMRAVGMSFLFCSQSISSGLSGLTDAGKNQIGIRLCMNHMSTADITETLAIKSSESETIERVKKFPKGHAMYRAGGETECKEVKILYISDKLRSEIIKKANAQLGDDYNTKEEIICKNSDRYEIKEKPLHPLNRFINGENIGGEAEEIAFYPAAPTTLRPEFNLPFSRNASCNLLLVGNDDNMRESVLFMSVCSILANPENRVYVNIVSEDDSDSIRLKNHMESIVSSRLEINCGTERIMEHIEKYASIKPVHGKNVFNIWYGLNKLKTAVSLAIDAQESKEETASAGNAELDLESLMDSLINHTATASETKKVTSFEKYEDYSSALRKLFEFGPECGLFNIVAYNNPKSFSKDAFLKLADFDYRIGLTMSVDDSYTVFGSEQFTKKANDSTAVCYTGSKTPVTIRPYLLPSAEWLDEYNKTLREREADF